MTRSAVRLAGLLALIGTQLLAPSARADGLLRVHPRNPRFFTDDSGRAIYLAGHQWFNDLQHNAWNAPVEVDWGRYLEFARKRKLNYLRNWVVWSIGDPTATRAAPLMPFRRTGPGTALDGKPRFDLERFDPAFFDRMRSQVRAAGEQGIYVSIMLFEVYGFMDRDGAYPRSLWAGNVLHGPNNVNDIDMDENGDGQGLEYFFTSDARILNLQRAYVRKVIDTVGVFDNVFFEIANELEARSWQYAMIRFVKEYEATKPKRHIVYMSPGGRDRGGRWSRLSRNDLLRGPADAYAVTRGWNRKYRSDPPVEPGTKPAIMDMDHVAADRDGDNEWNNNPTTPWKLLTRGLHQCIYDHAYWKPGRNDARWEATRYNAGMAAEYARRMDLAAMEPMGDLSSSGYCLAAPGREYLVFNPGTAAFSVSGLTPGRAYDLEWYQVASHRTVTHATIEAAAATRRFDAPFEDAVLYLVSTASSK